MRLHQFGSLNRLFLRLLRGLDVGLLRQTQHLARKRGQQENQRRQPTNIQKQSPHENLVPHFESNKPSFAHYVPNAPNRLRNPHSFSPSVRPGSATSAPSRGVCGMNRRLASLQSPAIGPASLLRPDQSTPLPKQKMRQTPGLVEPFN